MPYVTKQSVQVAANAHAASSSVDLPNLTHLIPDSINGYWVPATYTPSECILVWCISHDRFGVFRHPTGWQFLTAAEWHKAYLSPTPDELGLAVTDMGIFDQVTANSRRCRPQRFYMGIGTLRDALIRSIEDHSHSLEATHAIS
jgi:hypothetical protein